MMTFGLLTNWKKGVL